MEVEDPSKVCCVTCYCGKDEPNWEQVLHYKCLSCGKKIHYGCIHSLQPSSLLDDTFFTFKCQSCGDEGKEEFQRSNISWHNVVMLTLYNLQKMSQGKCGYFHWKANICAFIETHWTMFFGHQRKKTTLWMGTIAGTLSSGCPQFFTSGTKVVDQGYWKLATLEPPMPRTEKKKNNTKKRMLLGAQLELAPENRACRRARENALMAAIQLKEKKSFVKDNKDIKKQKRLEEEEKLTSLREISDLPMEQDDKPKLKMKKKNVSRSADSPTTFDLTCLSETCLPAYLSDQDSNSLASSELSLATSSSFSSSLKSSTKDTPVIRWDDDDFLSGIEVDIGGHEDLDIDIGSLPLDMRPSSPNFVDMFDMESEQNCFEMSSKAPITAQVPPVVPKKETTSDTESEGPSENNIDEAGSSDSEDDAEAGDSESGKSDRIKTETNHPMLPGDCLSNKNQSKGRPRKRRRIDDSLPPSPPPRLKRISIFEEGELLQKLNILASKETLRTDLAQLRRKLICNQTNREFGLPVFDLEVQMNQLENMESSTLESKNHKTFFPKPKSSKETRDLDRFMMHVDDKKAESRNYTSFRQRLVGLEDHELKPVVSPYTTRVLLPFIWRNYNPLQRPIKMKLLQEIIAYPHRNNKSWIAPSSPPIDYCYVRPEHIPSVNALCREFFWPGIDMSECLQYPDFSCVVLYRKIVIAFAFMVPDRGYNEAYISFIFTHPEWRGAGIATFMLYHLIQTCMGKDVLLHVSTTNPAMLLYQKFGFKCQELILNFYHKYFPLNCKDSRHAFLMRLSR